MVDNKSKTSLIRHIQKKYITHGDIFIRDRVRNLKFATSKTLVNFMKTMMFLSKN